MLCPITLDVPVHGVSFPDVPQQVFEFDALIRWIVLRRTNPITTKPVTIRHGFLIPADPATAAIVCAFVDRWGEFNDKLQPLLIQWKQLTLCCYQSAKDGFEVLFLLDAFYFVSNHLFFIPDGVITTYKAFAWMAVGYFGLSNWICNLAVYLIGCVCCCYAYQNGPLMVYLGTCGFAVAAGSSFMLQSSLNTEQLFAAWALAMVSVVTVINSTRCLSRRLDDF